LRAGSPPAQELAAQAAPTPVWPWGFLPALLLGGAMRLFPGLTHAWALNDGGLFLAMARSISSAGGLATTVTYDGQLPFCYPPMGFVLPALLSRLGLPLAFYFRVAPGLWSTAMVWAVWRLARAVWRDDRAAAAAALTLALLPWSYIWYIMGGGVARAPAYFFAVLAIERALRLFRDREANSFLLLTLFTALTISTHLECAHYLAVSLLVIALLYVRDGRNFGRLLAVLAGALLLTSPWWGLCLARYGLGPFLNAYDSGASGWQHRSWALSGEPYPLLGLVAAGGMGLALRRKDWLVPLWALAVVIAEPRSTRALLAVPIALAAGYCVASCWPQPGGRWKGARAAGATVLVVWGLLISVLFTTHMRSLTAADLTAMAFLKNHAKPGTNVLVLPAGYDWGDDRSGEWLPALTSCNSISTVQGAEWLPDNAFARRWRAHLALEKVTGLAGAEGWAKQNGKSFDMLYLPLDAAADPASRRVVAEVGIQAQASGKYRSWFSNPGVEIFARVP